MQNIYEEIPVSTAITPTLLLYDPPISQTSTTSTASRVSVSKQGTKRVSSLRFSNLDAICVAKLNPRLRALYKCNQLLFGKLVSRPKQVKRLQQALKVAASNKRYIFSNGDFGLLHRAMESFLLCNVGKSGKTKGVNRFTYDDKIMALMWLKFMRDSYKHLHRDFNVPSVKTLKNLLHKTTFFPGISAPLMDHFKSITGNMPDKRSPYCVLLFDVVRIRPHLAYDKNEDIIQGISNFGAEQRSEFAEHAFVFMLRSLYGKWKQPLAYMFVGDPLQLADLIRCIKDALRGAFSANFQVVATICDQTTMNMKAVDALKGEYQAECVRAGREFRSEIFSFDGREIVPIFDPPHLFKGLRNDFLTHDITFTKDDHQFTATWQDIINFYEYDITTCKRCNQLTDAHIYPHKMRKKSVMHCAQTLCRSVYVGIALLLREAEPELHNFAPTAEGTANLIHFARQLFDSCNGTPLTEKGRFQELKYALTKNSKHVQFWHEAKQMLGNMQFVKTAGGVLTQSLTNWIVTLEGLQYLWQSLERIGFTSLALRRCNQDALENFLESIRSPLRGNRNPSCASFISSFQTLSINNFSLLHSEKWNCLEDKDVLLTDFREFITQAQPELPNPQPTDSTNLDMSMKRWSNKATAYVTGFVAKRIIRLTNCRRCKTQLLNEDSNINVRQLTKNKLTRPNTNFMSALVCVIKATYNILPRYCHQRGIKGRVIKYIFDHFNFSCLSCEDHDISKQFVEITVQFTLRVYCRITNRLLSGQDTRLRHIVDPIQRLAAERYRKTLLKK